MPVTVMLRVKADHCLPLHNSLNKVSGSGVTAGGRYVG
jgi:hypothetical protein